MTYDGPSGKIALLGHEERQSASNGDDRISLDGAWDFLHTVEDYRAPPVEWRRIDVPGPWQAQFADLRMRGGTGIYRREFYVPEGWKRRRQFIRLTANISACTSAVFCRSRLMRRST